VNEHTTTHDMLQNIIATIVLENGAHIQKEISNLFLHHTQKQMDIVVTIFGSWWTLSLLIQLV
jgi:hypothetical protein